MSFPRHREIFPSDGGASPAANASAHRLDEFPAGYSSAGCSPAWPASASPAGHQYAVMSSCRSSTFHRTANCVLTVCVSRGGKRRSNLHASRQVCSERVAVVRPPLPRPGLFKLDPDHKNFEFALEFVSCHLNTPSPRFPLYLQQAAWSMLAMELIRLAIPWRVHKQSYFDYLIEAV
jgi:hypothetical protein